MGISHLTTIKKTASKANGAAIAKPVDKIKSQLVRVTLAEINAIRPSVYKYLLP